MGGLLCAQLLEVGFDHVLGHKQRLTTYKSLLHTADVLLHARILR
jgi:hypothetical protein